MGTLHYLKLCSLEQAEPKALNTLKLFYILGVMENGRRQGKKLRH